MDRNQLIVYIEYLLSMDSRDDETYHTFGARVYEELKKKLTELKSNGNMDSGNSDDQLSLL